MLYRSRSCREKTRRLEQTHFGVQSFVQLSKRFSSGTTPPFLCFFFGLFRSGRVGDLGDLDVRSIASRGETIAKPPLEHHLVINGHSAACSHQTSKRVQHTASSLIQRRCAARSADTLHYDHFTSFRPRPLAFAHAQRPAASPRFINIRHHSTLSSCVTRIDPLRPPRRLQLALFGSLAVSAGHASDRVRSRNPC